jgi:hypothetical protein
MAFLELEERITAAAGREGDAILAHHVLQAHRDAAFVEQAVAAARGRAAVPLRHKGQRWTSVWLPGGTEMVVETAYLRPSSRGRRGRKRSRRGPTGVGVYPVLEALGIADRVSPLMRSQLALYTVQAGSYQEAVSLLAERGFQVDESVLQRVAQSTAQADLALRDAALAQARQLPVPVDGPLADQRVRASVDGGRVRTRLPRRGRRTKIEILDREGKADRMRLPLYDVLLDDADATVALVIGYLRLLGAAHARVVEWIADGADWIWERSDQIRREAEIPAERWVEVIDFYHASEHLRKTVELCGGRKASERQAWYEELRHVLRREPAGALQVIDRLAPEARGRRAAKIKTAIEYFERHAHRMEYASLDRRRLPVGSGPVESAVSRVINKRFKGPSIFWNPNNVDDLMHLRAVFKSGRWHEVIQRVITQTFPVPSFAPMSRKRIRQLSLAEAREERSCRQSFPRRA